MLMLRERSYIMSSTKFKHLTLSERVEIESCLSKGMNAREISEYIQRDATTISKEIKRNRIEKAPNYFNSSKEYVDNLPLCAQQKRFPHVCNGCCPNKRRGCRKLKYYYSAAEAHSSYIENLRDSRSGYDINVDELLELDSFITPLIKQGQSLYHIKASNPTAIKQSIRTLYRYVEDELLDCRNIDLPRKVSYKPRKKRYESKIRPSKIGHLYTDYLNFLETNEISETVQMDTVEGLIDDEKCLLTIMFIKTKLMLIRLLPKQTAQSVVSAFDDIEKSLSSPDQFKKVFQVILTDNGPEFSDILGLMRSSYTGEKRFDLFFCDPMRSDQKGTLEKNHEHIRSIIPKGTSINFLTEEQVHKIESHINSYRRKSLHNKTPYEMFEFSYGVQLCQLLRLSKVSSNDIILKPSLIR